MAAKRGSRKRRAGGRPGALQRDPASGVMIAPDGGDRGPKERWQHGDVATVEGGAAPHIRVRTQTMLDRYWQRRQIDARQYHAGRRLYRQWRGAGGEPRLIASYRPRISGRPEMSDREADIRVAFTRAVRAVGRQLNEVVIHVCLTDGPASDWAVGKLLPKTDGIARLRAGLDALADHYRMPGGDRRPEDRDQGSEESHRLSATSSRLAAKS